MTAAERIVERMARREAAAQVLAAPWVPNAPYLPPLVMDVRRCPVCGADESTVRRRPDTLPLRWWRLATPGDRHSGASRLTVLGCERLAPRSVLPIVMALAGGAGPAAFRSRAVAWADHATGAGADLAATLNHIHLSERWADGPQTGSYGGEVTLPACTRPRRMPGSGRPPAAHFLTPHPDDSRLDHLNAVYLRHRLATVDLLLDGSPT
jgi:hypothetical protein